MKILFEKKELKALKKLIKDSNEANKQVAKRIFDVMNFPEEVNIGEIIEDSEFSLIDLLGGKQNKIYSMRLDFKGLEVEINPDFTSDFLEFYGKAITKCVPPIVAMFDAVQSISEDTAMLSSKWFDDDIEINISEDELDF